MTAVLAIVLVAFLVFVIGMAFLDAIDWFCRYPYQAVIGGTVWALFVILIALIVIM